MKRSYVALIRKEKGTEYWIDIPDIPGCVSSGKTIEEAKASFKEALDFHLEGMEPNYRENLPEPRSRAEVLAAEEDDFIDDYLVEINPATH